MGAGAEVHTAAHALFDTAIGRCGLAWRDEAVCAFALPGDDEAATVRALRRRYPESREVPPPRIIEAAAAAVARLIAGEPEELGFVPVDLSAVPPFERSVYTRLREVPAGRTITYGELAARCGAPGAARAVGAAMGRNPVTVIIPCHRVLAASGRSGGFSAPGGVSTKFRLLQIEQAGRGDSSLLFDDLPLALTPYPRPA